MKMVDVTGDDFDFLKLLVQLEASPQPIVVCRNGKPVADLIPHNRVNRIKTHPVLSKIEINYDPAESAGNGEWADSER